MNIDDRRQFLLVARAAFCNDCVANCPSQSRGPVEHLLQPKSPETLNTIKIAAREVKTDGQPIRLTIAAQAPTATPPMTERTMISCHLGTGHAPSRGLIGTTYDRAMIEDKL